jgi:hypothetical protein
MSDLRGSLVDSAGCLHWLLFRVRDWILDFHRVVSLVSFK